MIKIVVWSVDDQFTFSLFTTTFIIYYFYVIVDNKLVLGMKSDSHDISLCLYLLCVYDHMSVVVVVACRFEEGDFRHADTQKLQPALRPSAVQGPAQRRCTSCLPCQGSPFQ